MTTLATASSIFLLASTGTITETPNGNAFTFLESQPAFAATTTTTTTAASSSAKAKTDPVEVARDAVVSAKAELDKANAKVTTTKQSLDSKAVESKQLWILQRDAEKKVKSTKKSVIDC